MLRVKQERLKQGLSQAELARKAEINYTSLSRIERGLEKAFTKRGQKIADALGWKGDYKELFEEVSD